MKVKHKQTITNQSSHYKTIWCTQCDEWCTQANHTQSTWQLSAPYVMNGTPINQVIVRHLGAAYMMNSTPIHQIISRQFGVSYVINSTHKQTMHKPGFLCALFFFLIWRKIVFFQFTLPTCVPFYSIGVAIISARIVIKPCHNVDFCQSVSQPAVTRQRRAVIRCSHTMQ